MGELAFSETVEMHDHAIQFSADLEKTPNFFDDLIFDFGHFYFFLVSYSCAKDLTSSGIIGKAN